MELIYKSFKMKINPSAFTELKKISIDEKETSELSNLLSQVSASLKRQRKIIDSSEQNTFSMQKKSVRFPDDKVEGDIIHTDDLDFLAPPKGFDLFQASLPRSFLRIKEDVKKGDPVNEFNVEIIEEKTWKEL